MGSFITGIFDQLGKWLGDALDSVFGVWLGKAFGGLAKMMLSIGSDCYNSLVKLGVELLTQTPESWNGGSGWSVITSVNTGFIAVGASLVIIFWLIGIISLSVDERMNMRAEVMIKEFCKFIIAEFLVTNSIQIISVFFGLVDKLTNGFLPTSDSLKIIVPDNVSAFLSNPGFLDGLLCGFIGIIFLVGSVAAGASILYFTYIRFFKILLIIPYGAIASASIAGGHAFSHGAVSYYKYTISTILEAVTILLALKLTSAIISSNAIDIITNEGGTNGTTVAEWMIRALILLFVTLGAVKESSQITQRGMGM